MKALLLILVITVSVSAQKLYTQYDRVTDLTVVGTKEVTVWKPGFLYQLADPRAELKIGAFYIHRGHDRNAAITAGFGFESTSESWSHLKTDTMFVYADGLRFSFQLYKDDSVSRGGVTETMVARMTWEDMLKILNASDVEIRLGDHAFKVKPKVLEKLRRIISYK